jgi:hypothetical protein
LTVSRITELKALNIFSVEDLANVTDGNLGRLGMGGREFREAARTYISNAKDGVSNAALMDELTALRARLAALEAPEDKPKRRTEKAA